MYLFRYKDSSRSQCICYGDVIETVLSVFI